QFINNSTADTAGGANIKTQTWDFDVNTDSNGDGIKDNDLDSTDPNPTYEYPDYGIYRAKLTVEDDQGNKASVINFVNVKAPAASISTGAKQTGAASTLLQNTSVNPNSDQLNGSAPSTTSPSQSTSPTTQPAGTT